MPRHYSRFLKVVYLIGFKSTHKVYIGSSKRWPYRGREHTTDLRLGQHANPHLQRAHDKYGAQELFIEVVETFTTEEAMLRAEQKWMCLYHATNKEHGFNIVDTVGRPPPTEWTLERRQAMSAILQKRSDDCPGPYSRKAKQARAAAKALIPVKQYQLFDPSGNLVVFTNISQFSKNHCLDYQQIKHVLSGMKLECDGWKADLHRTNQCTKPFSLIGPNGEHVQGVGLRRFCKERGLPYHTMGQMVQGRTKMCRGWRRSDMPEERAKTHRGGDHILIGPSGQEVHVNNLTAYCLKHNLSYDSLRAGHKSRSGWKLKR